MRIWTLVVGVGVSLGMLGGCAMTDSKINYRQEMRDFVIKIAESARKTNPEFIVITQNGQELFFDGPWNNRVLNTPYNAAVTGVGQENLNYGYVGFNSVTPPESHRYMMKLLKDIRKSKNDVLVIDYSSIPHQVKDARRRNRSAGFVGFVAPDRALDRAPDGPVPYVSSQDIRQLNQARNFLYILNYHLYKNKKELLNELKNTDYDAIVMDVFFGGGEVFTKDEIQSLKTKKNGGERLVIAYMSIGEAEDYRYYWHDRWKKFPPVWLVEENPNWPGNYKVQYWHKKWQYLILSPRDGYLKQIVDRGFDGVYLDIIDGFEYFEAKESHKSNDKS